MKIVKDDLLRANRLAFPILFTFLTSFAFTFADQAIIGRTSLEGYAAVCIVSNIIYAITGSIGVMGLCVNILGANYLGSGDKKSYSNLFNTTLTASIIFGVMLEIIIIIFGKNIIHNGLNMTGDMANFGLQYLYISGIGIGINMMLFVLSAYFKSMENVSLFVPASIASNIVNLFFNYSLVFGKFGFPELGVSGAAIGTVLGLSTTLSIYIYNFVKMKDIRFSFFINMEYLKKLIKTYLPLVGQDLLESTLLVLIVSRMIAQMGAMESGIYSLTMFIAGIVMLPIYAYSNASVTLVAKAYGSEDKQGLRSLPYGILVSALTVTIIVTLPIFAFKTSLMGLITNDSNLIAESTVFIALVMILQMINSSHLIFKNALNGIGDEKWVLKSGLIITGISVICMYMFASTLELGLSGIYYGFGLNYVLCSVVFFVRYYRKTSGVGTDGVLERVS